MFRIFFIHSSVSGHVGCFLVLTTVNSATAIIGVCVSFSYGFSGSMSGLAGSYGSYVFNFLRNTHTVLCNAYTNLHSLYSVGEFSFLHVLASIYCL